MRNVVAYEQPDGSEAGMAFCISKLDGVRYPWGGGLLLMRERTRIRIARAVAFDLEGRKGPEIARILGMRPKGLESLRARPEYKAQLLEVGNELIRRMDEESHESWVRLMSGRVRPSSAKSMG